MYISSFAKRKKAFRSCENNKSITPNKQCEVWGGYNSIRWNWEDTSMKEKKLYALWIYRCWLGSEKVLLQTREEMITSSSDFCPHWSDSVIACQSSPPSFHLLITLCTQVTQIKERLQSQSRKLELKGFLSFYLSLFPRFLTPLFKELRQAEGWARQCLPEPNSEPSSPSPFTFSR